MTTTTTRFGSAAAMHARVQAAKADSTTTESTSASLVLPDHASIVDSLWLLVAMGLLTEEQAEALADLLGGDVLTPLPFYPYPTDPGGRRCTACSDF